MDPLVIRDQMDPPASRVPWDAMDCPVPLANREHPESAVSPARMEWPVRMARRA